jgi:hypothetical protein
MKNIIPLQTLSENILAELLAKAPDVKQVEFSMKDDTIETVPTDKWNMERLKTKVAAKLIRLIEDEEIKLLDADGCTILNRPEPLTAIRTCGVSPEAAEQIRIIFGLAKPIQQADEKPLRGKGKIAKYCGFSLSSIKRWIKKENFPYEKDGKIYISYPSQINFWMKNRNK